MEKLIVLPREFTNRDIKVVSLLHPKTKKESSFVVHGNKLYQVATVSPKSKPLRSIFIESEDISVHNADLQVCVPVNPLFILLPAIFTSTALPLDLILDITAGDYDYLPVDIAKEALGRVCTWDEGDLVLLDRARLDAYLRDLVTRVPVPESFKVVELDAQFAEAYQQFVGVNFISSWLPENIETHLRSLYDFTLLEQHVTDIIKKKEEANTIFTLNQKRPDASAPQQNKNKRGAPASKASAAKKPANNRSILDMFSKTKSPA